MGEDCVFAYLKDWVNFLPEPGSYIFAETVRQANCSYLPISTLMPPPVLGTVMSQYMRFSHG